MVFASQVRNAAKEVKNNRIISVAEEARQQNEAVALDVERLFMITEALWTIIKTQNNLTDENLTEIINDIDARSGKVDGRRKKEMRPDCPQCGRKMIGKNTTCLWCGATVKLEPFKKY
ncbi:MAG: hypothetical protein FWG05_04220 [Kiritimatiellaeota bacterium]|nr:hypothetical protein [Kiritimatiellota bacterium]